MGPTWGLPGADRTQVGPMWTTWTLLSGIIAIKTLKTERCHKINSPVTVDSAGCRTTTCGVAKDERVGIMTTTLGFQGTKNSIENKRSSVWRHCRHWWHRKLSLRQLTVPPVTTKLSNWQPFVFSEYTPVLGSGKWGTLCWLDWFGEHMNSKRLDRPFVYLKPVMDTVCSRAFRRREAIEEPRQTSPTSCMPHAICGLIDAPLCPLGSGDSHEDDVTQ